jgi:hypothetical protein
MSNEMIILNRQFGGATESRWKFKILGAFAKFRKETISYVMSARPSADMEQHGFHWTDFHET